MSWLTSGIRKVIPKEIRSINAIKDDPWKAATVLGGLTAGGIGGAVIGAGINDAYEATQKRLPREYDAQEFAAAIPRAEYQAYKETYEPLLQEYTDLFSPEAIQENAQTAYDRANQAMQSAQTTSEQDMARYGVNMTPRQKEAAERIRKLSKATAGNKAYNSTMDQGEAGRVSGLDFMANIGRDTGSQALGLANASAGLESGRNSTNDQLKADNAAGWASLGINLGTKALGGF